MSWPKSKNLEEMYALYLEGHSTRKVGAVFSVTGQSVYGLFNGNRYTMRNTGYYGRTNDKRSLLHRDIWECHNGAIPDGFDVHHIDENKENNVISNFECLPKADHTRIHAKGRNQHTKKKVPCGS